jgi:isopentenyl diphosphate isomerase/L-lactate dehydrogenase-like FMN-dependent dehydrogenase
MAPISDMGMYDKDGELSLIRASAHTGIALCLASKTTKPLKDIFAERDKLAASNQGLAILWYQLYMLADRSLTKTLIKEAVAGGVAALVFTVDEPVQGNREISPENVNKQMVVSSRDGASPFIDADATWKDIKFIRKYSGSTKVFVKGILSVEDAIRARDEGADGIILSNHGGMLSFTCLKGI